MDTALIVFTAGTVVSFIPLYWLAMRLSARRNRSARVVASRAPDPSGKREFLDLLRREAAARVVAQLQEALLEARLAAGHADGSPLSPETRRSLDETARLVDSLFARPLQEAFRVGADALAIASGSTIGAASATCTTAITAFERALEAGMVRVSNASPRPVPSGLLQKGRGLIGAVGLRAAA